MASQTKPLSDLCDDRKEIRHSTTTKEFFDKKWSSGNHYRHFFRALSYRKLAVPCYAKTTGGF